MKVTAIKKGFYGKIRMPGDRFEITDKKALGSWMKADPKAKTKTDPKAGGYF